MKLKLAFGLIISMAVFLVFSFIFFGNNPKRTDRLVEMDEEEGGEAFTNAIGAAIYEFNMTRNPLTGVIPEGVRELEMEEARANYKRQLSRTGRIQANAFSFQGPNNLGGRNRAIVYDVRYNGTSNQIIFSGGVSGGIYKSTDNGATWTRKSPTSQHFSTTSIAQDPRSGFQDTWYYATGESLGNSAGSTGAFYLGNGVYKSTDNGETWARLTASNTGSLESFDKREDLISKVAVDPTNGNVYMAAVDRIFQSTDGGASWTSVLTSGGGANSGMVTDIVVTSTGRLYASFSGTNSASPTNVPGVWTSTTGNSGSWTKIAGATAATNPAGWNANGTYGRVVLAVAPSNENIVYALYWNGVTHGCPSTTREAELYVWDQGTTTWTDLSSNLPNEPGCSVGNDPFAVQGGYDLVVAVKPDDANAVFIGGTNIYRSTDGFSSGPNVTRIGGYASASGYGLYTNSHPDIHAIAFQPNDPTIMLCGNDGGIQRTTDNMAGTVAWTPINSGFRTYQYYYVALDPRDANTKVIGGAQDNGTTRNIGGTGVDYEQVFSGDGGSVGLTDDIGGNTYEYVSVQDGDIYRRNGASGPNFGTNITPSAVSGNDGGLFITLFRLDPDNTEYLYYANADSLYRNTSASAATTGNWTFLSGVATSVGDANLISSLATTRGTYNAATASLFVGTNNGHVYRLDDPVNAAGATAPVDITGGSFPSGYVSSIAVNPRNDDTLLVTFSNYGVISTWWTGNANSATPAWVNVERNVTLPSVRSSAIAVTGNGVEYYMGTSAGLYTTTNPTSVDWTQDGVSEMGNAVISSMALRPSDNRLLVGTHGYGMWATNLSLPTLPVTLVSFTGRLEADHAALRWETATEINSSEFRVEKSIDGVTFAAIGTVPAAGNSSVARSYQFTDPEPAPEISYYRLQMADLDGKITQSPIIQIRNPNAQQQVRVLNNPFDQYIDIRLNRILLGKINIQLLDLSGRLQMRSDYNSMNQMQIRFATSGKPLSSGIYLLQVIVDDRKYSFRVVKR